MKTVNLSFRFNDDFEKLPYFRFKFRKTMGHLKWYLDTHGGWLWFRYNLNIYTRRPQFTKGAGGEE